MGRLSTGLWQSDRAHEVAITDATLVVLATDTAPITFTAVPPKAGVRRGIDRDGDGRYDGDERDAGSDPASPTSPPF